MAVFNIFMMGLNKIMNINITRCLPIIPKFYVSRSLSHSYARKKRQKMKVLTSETEACKMGGKDLIFHLLLNSSFMFTHPEISFYLSYMNCADARTH